MFRTHPFPAMAVALVAAMTLGAVRPFSPMPVIRSLSLSARPIVSTGPLFSSFASDSDDYMSEKGKDYDDDDDDFSEFRSTDNAAKVDEYAVEGEYYEAEPPPMSKNAGNRFVALVWDQEVDTKGRDVQELHYDRNELIEDHVMFIRKRNLYNETFNTDSMVDTMRCYHLLSSDVARSIGHALILETTKIDYIYDFLKEEPIGVSLYGDDISGVQLYRWRQIRDYTLRQDDGRNGCPCMLVALDYEPETVGAKIRDSHYGETMEYMIRSKRVIGAGPLHLATEFKDDPASIAVGDMVLFNAEDREDAIKFVEELPYAKAGLYNEMRVHFYNNIDVTGKFIIEDPNERNPCSDMREAMEVWGYPTSDRQTPWLNW